MPRNPFSRKAMRGLPNSNYRTNINQGGGSKKAGFPYMIGRDYHANIALGTKNAVVNKRCCNLASYQTMTFTSYARPSRPVGSGVMAYRNGVNNPIR
jgi:hypothetical protein